MNKSERTGHKVPDGGWGWVVVAAVALTNTFNQSILSVFGLLFGEHLQNMGMGTSGAALITNLNSLALNLSGIVIGPAIKSFSPRKVAFAGCFLTSSGLILCSVSTELWHLIICYSIIVGFGLGLIGPSTFMAINSYFDKKRGRAVGISMAGTGLGQMVLPHIVRILLDYYGFRLTIVILGSLALHGLVGASLFRPIEQNVRRKGRNMKEIKLLLDTKGDKEKKLDEIVVVCDPADKIEEKEPGCCQKALQRLVQAMDLELIKDPVFLSICVGTGLVYTSTINFSMLFPYFLQFSAGLSRKDTAMCMSVVAGADIVCRMGFPMITDRLKIPYRVSFLLGTVGLLCGRTVLAESFSFWGLIVISGVCGGFKSATVVNNNLVISEHCKPETLPGGLGLSMIAKGLLAISLGQLLGWLRDYTGSYILCLHLQDLLLLIVIIMWSPEIIYRHIKKRRSKCERINSIS